MKETTRIRFEYHQLDNGNWNAIDARGDNRVLLAANVALETAEKAVAKRRAVTSGGSFPSLLQSAEDQRRAELNFKAEVTQ